MENSYRIEIFTGPVTNSVFQDTKFLSVVLAQKARAANRFSQELEKIVKNIDRYIKEAKSNSGNCQDTKCFLAALEVAKLNIVSQAKTTREDARHFQNVATSLTENKDDRQLQKNLNIEEMAFRSLKDSFNKDLEDVNEAKANYFKAMMDKEVTEMKKYLATNESRIHQLEDREKELKEKIQKAEDIYKLAIDTANQTCQHLDLASSGYSDVWRPIAEKRSVVITETLASSILGGPSGRCHLNEINYDRLLSSLETKEEIRPPRFQEYVCTKKETNMTAKPDKLQRKRKAIALEDYRTDGPNHLKLKGGERLKVLLPENKHGLAFGEKKGKYGKKKKGFFPACLVQFLD